VRESVQDIGLAMVVGTQENGDIVLHVDVDLGGDRPVAFDLNSGETHDFSACEKGGRCVDDTTVNVGRGVRRRSAASAPQVRLGVGAKGCVWLRKAWGSARKDALGPLRRPAQRESKFVAAGTARRARTAGPPGIRVSRGRSGRPCFWPGGIVKSLQNATSAHASR